jgi:hypothetical protein
VKEPLAHLTLSAEDGEALIVRMHRSGLPRADAETVAWIIRLYFHVVLAIQEGTLTLTRLRVLLLGTNPSPSSDASPSDSPAAGEVVSRCGAVEVDAEAEATTHSASPEASQKPEQAKGGHRPGTGRLGAEAYWGATRA